MPQNKKFLAHKEREDRQKRIIIISTIFILVIVIGLVLYGVVDRYILRARTPVIELGTESISADQFEQQIRWTRRNLIIEIDQILATFQQLGGSQEMFSYFEGQLMSAATKLQEPILIGQEVIQNLSDELILQVEAELMGIIIDEARIDREIEEAFGYYVDGTPTPLPTRILPDTVATQQADQPTVAPQDDNNDEEPDPTATPILVPTEFTEDMFNDNFEQFLLSLKDAGVKVGTIRDIVRMSVTRQEIVKIVTADLEQTQEQVWIRHILVEDEDTALEITAKILEGADFAELAAEYSIDDSNKEDGGDLGWFARGRMVPPFEEAAFALEIGEISPPVQTDFGWHILESLGKDELLLDPESFDQLLNEAFSNWMNEKRIEHRPVINPDWVKFVPSEPNLPADYLSYIEQLSGMQPQLPPDVPLE
jgi:peptidyl-prolyl cis-trans isomerase D